MSALDRLPFVVPPTWSLRPDWKHANYWNDNPPDDHPNGAGASYITDHKRGQKFAAMTVAALREDFQQQNLTDRRRLEQIFEAMLKDAIKRQRKGGRGSRTPMTSAMHGFLGELSKAIYAAVNGETYEYKD